jgi:hypothetical protein
MSICPACEERGKTWEGDDPKCAFSSKDKCFDDTNWNCATMNGLRNHVQNTPFLLWNDDYYYGLMSLPGKYTILLIWYKRRGRIATALELDGPTLIPLRLSVAQAVLNYHENRSNQNAPS